MERSGVRGAAVLPAMSDAAPMSLPLIRASALKLLRNLRLAPFFPRFFPPPRGAGGWKGVVSKRRDEPLPVRPLRRLDQGEKPGRAGSHAHHGMDVTR